MRQPSLPRRRLLAAGAAAVLAGPALAQPRPITVAQIFDGSPREQDVSKDFLVGSRAAWQDINARGGVRGRPVEHLALEVDGRAASLQQAWRTVRETPSCVVLSGTVADPVATALARSRSRTH